MRLSAVLKIKNGMLKGWLENRSRLSKEISANLKCIFFVTGAIVYQRLVSGSPQLPNIASVHTADNVWCVPSSSCSLQSHLVAQGMAGSTVKKPCSNLCTIVNLHFLWKCDSSLYGTFISNQHLFWYSVCLTHVSKGSSVNKMEDKKYQQNFLAYFFMTFLVDWFVSLWL